MDKERVPPSPHLSWLQFSNPPQIKDTLQLSIAVILIQPITCLTFICYLWMKMMSFCAVGKHAYLLAVKDRKVIIHGFVIREVTHVIELTRLSLYSLRSLSFHFDVI